MATSYPPAAAPGQVPPPMPAQHMPAPPAQQVPPEKLMVQAPAPTEGTRGAPMMMPTSEPKPKKSDVPMIVFFVSFFTGFCCPCGFGYYVYEDQKYKKKLEKWEKHQAEERAFMMAQAMSK